MGFHKVMDRILLVFTVDIGIILMIIFVSNNKVIDFLIAVVV